MNLKKLVLNQEPESKYFRHFMKLSGKGEIHWPKRNKSSICYFRQCLPA